jgi:hypothetical protein
MNDLEAKRTLDVSKGRKAAVLVMDSQAQKESAIGLLYGCSRVILRHGADDTPCETGGSANWNPGCGLEPISKQS